MAIPQTPSPLANVLASKTYNALWFQATGFSNEQTISAAIAAAAADGASFVYVPTLLFPYNINNVVLNPLVSLIQESSVLAGYGSPEGVYPAPIGFLYQQLDGTSGNILWQKVSGTGTTGWSLLVSAISTQVGSIQTIVNRSEEWRVIPVSTAATNLNDGTGFEIQMPVLGRFSQPLGTVSAGFMRYTTSNNMIYRQVDGRRCLSPEGLINPAPGVGYALRPFGATPAFPQSDIRATYAPTSSSAVNAPTPQSVSWMAWCRKRTGGDSSHSRVTFGFGDLTVTSPSKVQPRCGLIGDGAGGYRFGSVNCPDGAATGDNAAADIDANAVQPAELTNANLGTNWFHVRIKMIPPTPTAGSKWGAYLNGNLVATFTDTTTNFPRGAQTTSHDFGRIEAQIVNFGDTGVLIPAPVFYDVRLVIEDDLTL